MAVSFIKFLELNLLISALHRSFIELLPERDGDDSVSLGVEDQYGTADLLDPPVRVELHVEEGQESVGEGHARAGVEGGEGGVGEGAVGVGGEVNDLLSEVVVRGLQYEAVHPVTVLRQSSGGHSSAHGVTPDHQPVPRAQPPAHPQPSQGGPGVLHHAVLGLGGVGGVSEPAVVNGEDPVAVAEEDVVELQTVLPGPGALHSVEVEDDDLDRDGMISGLL